MWWWCTAQAPTFSAAFMTHRGHSSPARLPSIRPPPARSLSRRLPTRTTALSLPGSPTPAMAAAPASTPNVLMRPAIASMVRRWSTRRSLGHRPYLNSLRHAPVRYAWSGRVKTSMGAAMPSCHGWWPRAPRPWLSPPPTEPGLPTCWACST